MTVAQSSFTNHITISSMYNAALVRGVLFVCLFLFLFLLCFGFFGFLFVCVFLCCLFVCCLFVLLLLLLFLFVVFFGGGGLGRGLPTCHQWRWGKQWQWNEASLGETDRSSSYQQSSGSTIIMELCNLSEQSAGDSAYLKFDKKPVFPNFVGSFP